MHFLAIAVGPHVQRQLAFWSTRTRLTPYRKHVTVEELERHQSYVRRHPVDGVDPDDIAAVLRWAEAESLAAEGVGQDERGWYFWTTENWKARWDYWIIGGSWAQHLIIREGGAAVRADHEFYMGAPDPQQTELWQQAPKDERLRAAQTLKRHIDFDAMKRRAEQSAGQQWDDFQAELREGRRDSLMDKYINGFSREQYLARTTWHPAYLVIDGLWHERGDLGLRASISDERATEWTTFVTDQFARLPDDTLITCIDCHT